MGMVSEFKAFALKGSLIDTAVAFVMGVAFGSVSTTFINGLFMPLVGLVFQVGDLSKARYVLSPEVLDAAGKVATPESAILYGAFIGATINFLIIAFIMFMVVKGMNSMKKAEEPAAPAGPSSTDQLLMEIRDSLKK